MLRQDIRDGVRALTATPVITLVATLSLALGIGANAAIFSILDSLLLRSLPVAQPQQLARLAGETGERPRVQWPNPVWERIRDRQTRDAVFDGAFAWSSTRFNLAHGGVTELVDGLWASGETFAVLGVPAILGRTFTPAHDRRGGGPDGAVAVISHQFWQRRFGGDANVIGRRLTLDRVPVTIIGVTPASFFGVEVGRTFDVAVPIAVESRVNGVDSRLDQASRWWLQIMLRLKPDQPLDAAAAMVRGLQASLRDETMPAGWLPGTYLKEPFLLLPGAAGESMLRTRYERPLTTIMIVVAVVLVIACANIANLQLARAMARRHEIGVRMALGASRWRIARALIVESLLLSGAGALLGLLFARWSSDLLVQQLSTATNHVFLALPLDWRMLSFTTATAIATTLLFGVAPALRSTRVAPQEALRAHGRSTADGHRHGISHALIVLQVALSVTLVVTAGLFMRTFVSLMAVPLGFHTTPVLLAQVGLPGTVTPAERGVAFERLRAAAAQAPGVASAALSEATPAGNATWIDRVEVAGGAGTSAPESGTTTFFNMLSADWFQTYGMPLIAGRDFTAADTEDAPRVAIVNEAFARRHTGGRNPIGMRLLQGGGSLAPRIERVIVGYVKDAVYQSARQGARPIVYVPYVEQVERRPQMTLSVRARAGSAESLMKPLAAALTQVDGSVSITFRPLTDQMRASLTQERLLAALSAFFGGLALLLAGLGLYGVTSYVVSRRQTEIGIRLALGAQPIAVVSLVMRRIALLVGLGAIAGVILSLWASRFVASLLFALQPRDPATIAAAVCALAAIAILAGWLPARRAARIDPARTLRL